VVQGDEKEGAFTVAQGYLFPLNPDDVVYKPPGNYWIIGIGPIVDNQYQWAVVSTPEKANCFVLARDVSTFKENGYESDALKVFDEFGGFDNFFSNKPFPTSHFLCFGYFSFF